MEGLRAGARERSALPRASAGATRQGQSVMNTQAQEDSNHSGVERRKVAITPPGDEAALRMVLQTADARDNAEPSQYAFAIAAAELVAALRGQPSERLPASVIRWISSRAQPVGEDLVCLARQAVERVLNSTLRSDADPVCEPLDGSESGLRRLLARLQPG